MEPANKPAATSPEVEHVATPKPNPSRPTFRRRDFIILSALTALRGTLSSDQAGASTVETTEFARLIPPDKHLDSAWAASLTERGTPRRYTKSKNELRYIGMPIGGVTCGTVYLGGDGRLWVWDIFNENKTGVLPHSVRWEGFGQERNIDPGSGANFVDPLEERSPFEHGFAIRVNEVVRPLDGSGWNEIEFVGQYPIGEIRYSDTASPVHVELTAYSPFVPLNTDDSGLPATLCEYAVHNNSNDTVEVEFVGWLENACSLYSAGPNSGTRINEVHPGKNAATLLCRFDTTPIATTGGEQPNVVIDNFDRDAYAPWTTQGDAFGSGPVRRNIIPAYQGDVGGEGAHVVNSHASSPGSSVTEKDSHTGLLISPSFVIERSFISFYIGGGGNVAEVGMRLIVDGKVVRRSAGHDDNKMTRTSWDVREFKGKSATIEVYDNGRGPWGNVGVSAISQTNEAHSSPPKNTDGDYGTMALSLFGTSQVRPNVTKDSLFSDSRPATGPSNLASSFNAKKPAGEKLIGAVSQKVKLSAGSHHTFVAVTTWHFRNCGIGVPDAAEGNYYCKRFDDAGSVAAYIANEYPRLSRLTKLWRETWYDSTLPHWFLDRTFANTSILATTTAHRFGTGRFWGWEGIGCCFGTCCHVWHYAQAPGRLFPELERNVREHVDFQPNVGFDEATGMIRNRGEGSGPAVDGQCGRILGVYREYLMSPDAEFLKRIWPHVRKGMEFIIGYDKDGDGLLVGPQANTLDADWYGKIPWISSLYAAALKACNAMAKATGDKEFEALCDAKWRQSAKSIEAELFNGEYFIQKPQPGREGTLGTYGTSHIDQVHGQSWAWQVNLGRVLDREKTVSALKALYKYNFTTDIGPFRLKNKEGRAYALAGNGGLIMATNPTEQHNAFGNVADWQYGYFNECMSGFEHQAASHMIAEGLVHEGLAVTRAIHDRYDGARRNPYNEIECSDHYSRAMASYGSLITMCGFELCGPEGHIGFAPRLTADRFRCPYTSPEGWGTFEQNRTTHGLSAELHVRYGRLAVRTIALQGAFTKASVHVQGAERAATVSTEDGRSVVKLGSQAVLTADHKITITLA